MIVTNKVNYKPLKLDARQIMNIKEHSDSTLVLMKDGSLHQVDEKAFHVKTLMLVELTANNIRKEREKV